MTATHTTNSTVSNAPALYLALDLGTRDWKLAFTVGLGQNPRLKTINARSTSALLGQIKAAKKRFQPAGECSGGLLLRSGTRRFLAPSLLAV